MKKFLTLTILFLLFCLTGCANLQEEETMISEITSIIDGSKYIKTEQPLDEDGTADVSQKIYYFEGKEFDFTVTDYIESSGGGLPYNDQMTDYYEKLLEFKNEEIHELTNEYDFEIVVDDPWQEGLEIEIKITSFQQIKEAYAFCVKLYSLLEKYVPKRTSDIFPHECSLDIKTTSESGSYLYGAKFEFIQGGFKINEKDIAFTEAYYVEDVRNGELIDSTVGSKHFEKFKPLTLDAIYINGKEFKSEKEEKPRIVFNIADGKYYITVGYGAEFAYNGGVNDYINREIIEEYYPGSNYEINADKNYSTYEIDGDKYKVTRNDKTHDYRFYKNSKELDIKDYEEVTGYHSGATYFRLVKAEDFAELTGLKLVEIDYNSGIVYFETK